MRILRRLRQFLLLAAGGFKTVIGGQALIEGIMMLGPDKRSIVVRKPDGELEVKTEPRKLLKDKYPFVALPLIRGVVNFCSSMYNGMTALMYSAEFFPEEEEEEDPRAELVQQLLEYKMYKCMAYELRDRQMDAEQVFFKEPTIPPEVAEYEEPVDLAELVGDMNLAKLDQIFKSIMKKQVDKIDPVRSKFGKIEKEEVSLSDKMLYVEDFCKTHRNFSFRNLLEAQASKVEVIVTFLAILELMKVGKIFISQEHTFDDIKIESKMAA